MNACRVSNIEQLSVYLLRYVVLCVEIIAAREPLDDRLRPAETLLEWGLGLLLGLTDVKITMESLLLTGCGLRKEF